MKEKLEKVLKREEKCEKVRKEGQMKEKSEKVLKREEKGGEAWRIKSSGGLYQL